MVGNPPDPQRASKVVAGDVAIGPSGLGGGTKARWRYWNVDLPLVGPPSWLVPGGVRPRIAKQPLSTSQVVTLLRRFLWHSPFEAIWPKVDKANITLNPETRRRAKKVSPTPYIKIMVNVKRNPCHEGIEPTHTYDTHSHQLSS